MKKFAVSNILDHHTNQHHSEVLAQRNGHYHSLHLVHTAHTNYEQGIVCPIRGKKGCLHAFNMIQLQHSHPPQQGHQWTQFSKITMFYKTMHLPAQPCQEGLSHSEPLEFVLVPDTPTRTMLPPRKFSHNIEQVDRASASQLVATPVGCQGSPETNQEHLKNGFNKTNPYLDMKEGQPVSHQHTPGLLSSQPWRQFTQYHPQEQVCRVLQNHIHLHHDVLGISSIHHPTIHGAPRPSLLPHWTGPWLDPWPQCLSHCSLQNSQRKQAN